MITNATLGPIALLRGFVACGKPDILLEHLPDTEECDGANSEVRHTGQTTLLEFLYDCILALCNGDITVHYQAFQTLSLWYVRVSRLLSSKEVEIVGLVSRLPPLLESTLAQVVTSWASPVDDVPEIVVEVFSTMMTTWASMQAHPALSTQPDMRAQAPDLVAQISDTIRNTPWHVKGKYRVWAAAIKYMQGEQVTYLQANIGVIHSVLVFVAVVDVVFNSCFLFLL